MDFYAGGHWQDELLPAKLDRLAEVIPNEPWAEFPKIPNNYEEGFYKITYKGLANIVNGLAWWLRDSLGTPEPGCEVISYIGPNDFRYPALVLAAAKAGYVLFLTSPRNSLIAHDHLFKELNCKVLISIESPTPLVTSIITELDLKNIIVPSVLILLNTIYEEFPFTKDYQNSLGEPFAIVHTSGSSGIPKPLIWTHATAIGMLKAGAADPPPGQKSLDEMWRAKRVLLTFPPFHAAGIVCYVLRAIAFKTVMVTPAAEGILTAEDLAAACIHNQIDVGFLVPSLVAELANNSSLLDICAKHLELILYCGGDLPQVVGDVVSYKCPLYCQYGTSEIGIMAQLIPINAAKTDWHYVQFNPCVGIEFEEYSNNLFEVHVKKDILKSATQPVFSQLPKLHLLTDYATKDLFAPHPTIPNFWTYKARSDDIIVFLNGEKTNPISMEQTVVSGAKEIRDALVIGDQRFQAAILIEPNGEIDSKEHFIESIWPLIEEANVAAPAHARVEKDLIMLTNPAKPMKRAGKGTVQRKATLELYAEEIQELYNSIEKEFAKPDNEVKPLTYEDIRESVQNAVQSILGLSPKDNDNLFLLGMDSMQGLQLMRELKRRFYLPALTLQMIYKSSTISELARSLTATEVMTFLDRKQQMQDIYDKLAVQLQSTSSINSTDSRVPRTVILTGSTGGLGTYLLDTILKDSTITHVYCLNRRMDDMTSHIARLDKRDSYATSMTDKVSFLQVDFNQIDFGLDPATFKVLKTSSHYIIHNAWTVNFNLSLEYYVPQLHGLIKLLQFADSTSSRFVFVSSISSVMSLKHSPVMETISMSWDSPAYNGYAESKCIGERLCAKATQTLGIQVTSMRIGQIAGPVQAPGLWNPKEWVPTMISAATQLGTLPEDLGLHLGNIDWVPIDLASQSVWEAVTSPLPYPDVLHFCNPRSTDWSSICLDFQKALQQVMNSSIDIVSTEDWLDMVQYMAEENPSASVAKLQDFYRANLLGSSSQWLVDCGQAVERSQTLRSLPEVGPAWIQKWVQEWHNYSGTGSTAIH